MGLKRAAGRRRGKSPDRFEGEELEFHQKLRAAYHALVQLEPQRCVLIDARAAKKVVAKRIWQAVCKKFELQPPVPALEQTEP
jgi:dTMP kinase